jgi:hypothetical protein
LGSEASITLVEYNKLLACRREEFLATEIISKYHKTQIQKEHGAR